MASQAFAEKIVKWLKQKKSGIGLKVLSSTQPGTINAAKHIGKEVLAPVAHQSGLNPIDCGITDVAQGENLLESMRFDERFAGGESFQVPGRGALGE